MEAKRMVVRVRDLRIGTVVVGPMGEGGRWRVVQLVERTPYLTRVVMEELGAGDDAPLYNPQLDPDAELTLFEGDLASVQEERQHLQRELVEHLKDAVNIAGILGRSLEAHHVQGGAFWDNLAGNLEGYRRAAEVEPAR